MSGFLRDLTTSLRAMRREPAVFLTSIATLALALASTTALVAVVNQIVLRPLPFPDEARIVRVRNADVSDDGQRVRFNMGGRQVALIAARTGVFSGLVALDGGSGVLLSGGAPERVSIVSMSAGWARTLGVRPEVGRLFTTREHDQGRRAGAAIISHALWAGRFGGRSDIMRQAITIDQARYAIVGVFPAAFRFPYSADVWVPARLDEIESAAVFGRLAPGVTLTRATNAMAGVMPAQHEAVPQLSARAAIDLEPARDSFIADEARVAFSLLAITAAFLLLAVGNVAHLLLARNLARGREIAVRAALGATAWHQFRFGIAEVLILAVLAGSLGLVLAGAAAAPLQALVPANFVRELNAGAGALDLRVFAFAVALSVAAGAIAAAFPIWQARTISPRDALADGARGSSGRGGPLRLMLAASGVALSLAVISAAVVLGRHLIDRTSATSGLDRDRVLTLQVDLPDAEWPRPEGRLRFVNDALARLDGLPGIGAAGFMTANPVAGATWTVPIVGEGSPGAGPSGAGLMINHRLVAGRVLEALGVRILRGRRLDARDTASTPAVAVVSDALARRLWPGQSPLGRRVRIAAPGSRWIEVVGVVSDVRDAGDVPFTWYLPFAQHPASAPARELHAMIRSAGTAAPALPPVARAIHGMAAHAAIFEAMPLAAVYDETIAQDRLGARLATALAALGLLMATFGLYGIVAYSVRQRSVEFAIRRSLGATGRHLTMLLLRHVGVAVGGGLAAGCVAAAILTRAAATQIPDLPAGIGLRFVLPLAIVAAACVFGIWGGARRLGAGSLTSELHRS